jgi:tellurite resistance protein TehA-like permease
MEISYHNLFCFYRFASQTQIFSIKTVLFQAIGILRNIRYICTVRQDLGMNMKPKPVNQDRTHTLSYVQDTWVKCSVWGTGFIASIYLYPGFKNLTGYILFFSVLKLNG